MKKSKRILLLLWFMEAILIGGGFLLLNMTKDMPSAPGYDSGETASRIGQMMGLFGGGIGGVLLVLYFVVRAKERDE